MENLTVEFLAKPERLDLFLSKKFPEYSRNFWQNQIKNSQIFINQQLCCENKKKLFGGEIISFADNSNDFANLKNLQNLQNLDINEIENLKHFLPSPEVAEIIQQNCIYEDADILVINKPANLVVHPGSGHFENTLLNGLLFRYPQTASKLPRAGIVHRLDRLTSGLMVIAKNLIAQTHLVRQLQTHSVKRQYLALVKGDIFADGFVDAPIGRNLTQRTKMAIVPEIKGGKVAKTHYFVRQRFGFCTLLRCLLETGRTHQIRVHLASLGHSLIGDFVYGNKNIANKDKSVTIPPEIYAFERQALHAQKLTLQHPQTLQNMEFVCDLPEDFANLLNALNELN